MSDNWEISILGLADSDNDPDGDRAGARGWFRPDVDGHLSRNSIAPAVLRDNLAHFLQAMRGVVSEVPDHFGVYELSEVTLSAEVSASGKVSLMGSGAEVGGTGGITFKLVRKAEPEDQS
jgi:hypothetical protein